MEVCLKGAGKSSISLGVCGPNTIGPILYANRAFSNYFAGAIAHACVYTGCGILYDIFPTKTKARKGERVCVEIKCCNCIEKRNYEDREFFEIVPKL